MRRRRGFSAVEIAAAVAVVALLAAVVVPTVTSVVRPAFADALGDQLEDFQQAALLYRQDIGVYPGLLTNFVRTPASNAPDLCTTTALGGPQISNWRGPYVDRTLISFARVADFDAATNPDPSDIEQNARIPFYEAAFRNQLVRDGDNMVIAVLNVGSDAAAILERRFDNDVLTTPTDTDGRIRWAQDTAFIETGTAGTTRVPQRDVLFYAALLHDPCA